jgi:hypothetical protein
MLAVGVISIRSAEQSCQRLEARPSVYLGGKPSALAGAARTVSRSRRVRPTQAVALQRRAQGFIRHPWPL